MLRCYDCFRKWQRPGAGQGVVQHGGGGGHRHFLKTLKAKGLLKGKRGKAVFEGLSATYFALPEEEMNVHKAWSVSSDGGTSGLS